jgi:hypothetical protein
LSAVRSEGAQLTSADGETTSHIMGTFYRTIRMIDNGIKPVYVFDGKVESNGQSGGCHYFAAVFRLNLLICFFFFSKVCSGR